VAPSKQEEAVSLISSEPARAAATKQVGKNTFAAALAARGDIDLEGVKTQIQT
jgi:hypothetical protein